MAKVNTDRLKYLEMIQSIISRMANNSFLIKGWIITLSLAGFTLFASKHENIYLSLIIFSVLIFWILDGYYLRQEKLFRELYEDHARISKKELNHFSMNTKKHDGKIINIIWCLLSFPTSAIYLFILLVTLVFLYLSLYVWR